MPQPSLICVLLLASLLTACRGDADADTRARGPAVGSLPGTYAGRFACRNCPGIDVALWLRGDGAFFMRQDYLGEDAAPPERVYKLGRWAFEANDRTLLLRGRGPELRFTVGNSRELTLVSGTPQAQVLRRDDSLGPFEERVRIEGEYTLAPERFHECVSALDFALDDTAGSRDLRRKYRNVSRPETPALVTLEARFKEDQDSAAGQLSLEVERVIELKPKTSCSAG